MDVTKTTLIVRLSINYIIEGLVIAFVAYYIPLFYKNSLRKPTLSEIFTIALTAALTMALLDIFSPPTALGLRFGAGIKAGNKVIGV